MSEFTDLAGKRDYSTPLPMTGKPYQKTYWDWNCHRWRTSVCILLGARETPPSVPYRDRGKRQFAERAETAQRDTEKTPKRPAPLREPQKTGPAPGSLRDQIRQHLRTHGPATTAEIITAIRWPNRRSVSAVIHNDPAIVQVDGLKGSGRRQSEEKARWMLRQPLEVNRG